MTNTISRDHFMSQLSDEHCDAFEDAQAADVYLVDGLETSSPSHPSRLNRSPRNVGSLASRRQADSQPGRLQFLPLADWDEHNSYDEDTPSCLHYLIEWKVSVNNKVVSKDTEQDLVLTPVEYWHMYLKPKLEKLLRRKLAQNRHVRCDDTNVVVSVTDRTERDLAKRFDDVDIDWSVVEKQLIAWGELFRLGKKLRVDLSFNYVDSNPPTTGTIKRSSKNGTSATQQMLAARATQLDTEEEGSGQPSIWRDVYALMQCPGLPCNLGPHCWRDSFGKKHYRLRTNHLKALVTFVEQGNTLQSHDDVPEDI